MPNHQISFIWAGRALGDCTAAIITSVVFRSRGLGLLDMSLLVCFILSDGSFANPGRSCLSSRSAFSSQEGSDSLCLSSPASLFFFRLSLELDSSSAATTPPTTPWSSTCSDLTSDFDFLTYFACCQSRCPPYIQSLHAFTSAGFVLSRFEDQRKR